MVAPNPKAPQLTPSTGEVPLSSLGRGGRGRIVRVLDTADATRLKALGLCEGREIEVLRTGGALVVRVLGSRIGLASELAASVVLAA